MTSSACHQENLNFNTIPKGVNSSQSLDMGSLLKPKQKTKTNKSKWWIILQRRTMKKTHTNKVCHTLRLGGSWNLLTLNSRVGEWGGGWERRKTLSRLQKCSHVMMRQLLLHSILLSYFTSKIFHFFFQQIKAST